MNSSTLNFGHQPSFGPADYSVFGIMLTASLSIGVYFGFCGKGSDNTEEYLLGGRKMKVVPIAISLVASQLSGISIMSLPAEMYIYGTQFAIMLPVVFLVTAVIVYIFIPVFYGLNLGNCYEYLELRFDKKVRELISAMFIFNLYLGLPITIFIPALAFAQVTNLNIHLINAVVGMICVVYTMLGGIKAVVWTDVVQAGVMVTSCFSVAILGVINVGGVGEVWRRAEEGGRIIFFNMDPSPTARTSFWNTTTGLFCLWCSYVGLSQSCVQRYVSLPTIKQAQKAMWLFYIGFFVIMFLNLFTGLIMFATYHQCDPLKLGLVSRGDQLMPYFVSQTVGHIPGMPGVFIACVFSAALSTMSACLNSMSGIIYESYIRRLNLFRHTEHRASVVMKAVVMATGCYCVAAGLLVEQFEHILQVILIVTSLTTGATLGSFTLGMLAPKCGPRGAFYGSLASLLVVLWIATGAQLALFNGSWSYPKLPSSTAGCSSQWNNLTGSNGVLLEDYRQNVSGFEDTTTTMLPTMETIINSDHQTNETENEPFFLYKISFNYFFALGTVVTWVVGLLVSYFWDNEDPSLKDRRLYAPCVHKYLPRPAEGQTKALEIIRVDEFSRKFDGKLKMKMANDGEGKEYAMKTMNEVYNSNLDGGLKINEDLENGVTEKINVTVDGIKNVLNITNNENHNKLNGDMEKLGVRNKQSRFGQKFESDITDDFSNNDKRNIDVVGYKNMTACKKGNDAVEIVHKCGLDGEQSFDRKSRIHDLRNEDFENKRTDTEYKSSVSENNRNQKLNGHDIDEEYELVRKGDFKNNINVGINSKAKKGDYIQLNQEDDGKYSSLDMDQNYKNRNVSLKNQHDNNITKEERMKQICDHSDNENTNKVTEDQNMESKMIDEAISEFAKNAKFLKEIGTRNCDLSEISNERINDGACGNSGFCDRNNEFDKTKNDLEKHRSYSVQEEQNDVVEENDLKKKGIIRDGCS